MPLLRRSRLPGLLLLLVLGFAVLLPELAHSRAHRGPVPVAGVERHGHGHGHHHQPAAVAAHHQDGKTAVGEQDAAPHPHFELRPVAASKTPFPSILGARAVVDLVFDTALRWSPSPFRQDQLTIALRNHGPPPPSRAPPLS